MWKKFLALAGCRLVQAVDEVEDNCISAAQVGALAVKPFNGMSPIENAASITFNFG